MILQFLNRFYLRWFGEMLKRKLNVNIFTRTTMNDFSYFEIHHTLSFLKPSF